MSSAASKTKLKQKRHIARSREMDVLMANEGLQNAHSELHRAEQSLEKISNQIQTFRLEMTGEGRLNRTFNPSLHMSYLNHWADLQDELTECQMQIGKCREDYEEAKMNLQKAQSNLRVMSTAVKQEIKNVSRFNAHQEWLDTAHRVSNGKGNLR